MVACTVGRVITHGECRPSQLDLLAEPQIVQWSWPVDIDYRGTTLSHRTSVIRKRGGIWAGFRNSGDVSHQQRGDPTSNVPPPAVGQSCTCNFVLPHSVGQSCKCNFVSPIWLDKVACATLFHRVGGTKLNLQFCPTECGGTKLHLQRCPTAGGGPP